MEERKLTYQLFQWSKSIESRHAKEAKMNAANATSKNVNSNTAQPQRRKPFQEQYVIKQHLGTGSFSKVILVSHRKFGGKYAAKIVDKKNLSRMDKISLYHEVQVLKKVNHQHIMKLYDVLEDDSKCCLITEYASGGDLFDRIIKHGKLKEVEAQKITAALVDAIEYCHTNNVIHRDIKPENVLLNEESIKLGDFGFARQLELPNELISDSCGTPGYAAPEVLRGRPYGFPVDIFSLGVVVYILLCGYPPFPMTLAKLRQHHFKVDFPPKDWAHVPFAVQDMLSSMMHIEPFQRPTATGLKSHPWIHHGYRLNHEHQQRVLSLRRDPISLLSKDSIYALLQSKGLTVQKYGRSGRPHITKLTLCKECNAIIWQRKGFQSIQNTNNITNASVPSDIIKSSQPFSMLSKSNSKSTSFSMLQVKHSIGLENRHSDLSSATSTTSTKSDITCQNNTVNSKIHPKKGFKHLTPQLIWKKLLFPSQFQQRMKENVSPSLSNATTPTVQEEYQIFCLQKSPCCHLFNVSCIYLNQIESIKEGAKTKVFQRYKHDMDEMCSLSCITTSRTLDVEFDTPLTRNVFKELLSDLICEFKAKQVVGA